MSGVGTGGQGTSRFSEINRRWSSTNLHLIRNSDFPDSPLGPKNFLKLFARNLQRRGKDIMKTPRFKISIVTAAAVGTLVLIAIPALATFPGENGRIAFARRDPNIGDFEIGRAHV